MADKTDDAGNGVPKPQPDRTQDIADIFKNGLPVDGDDGSGDDDDDKGDGTGDDKKPVEAGKQPNGDDAGDGTGDGSDDGGAGAGDDKGEPGNFQYPQFKGDGSAESYTSNLEKAYGESTTEAIRIKDERDVYERQVNAIKEAASKDKDFEKKIVELLAGNGGSGDDKGDDKSSGIDGKIDGSKSDNPFLRDAQTKWETESAQEAKEFADANPEVLTDPKINADVKRWMRIFSNEEYERNGRLMKSGEAMSMAYNHLGLTDKRKAEQDLADGLKGQAAPTRPSAPKKKSTSSSKQFSDLTLGIAGKMGISRDRLEKSKSKRS